MTFGKQLGWLIVLCVWLAGCITTVDGPFTAKTDKTKAASQYVQLGLAYFQEEEYEVAIQKLNKALEIEPDQAEANAALGLVYQTLKEFDVAEDYFLKALNTDPKHTRGRTYYAAFLYQQDRLSDSINQFNIAAEDVSYSSRAQIFSNIGLLNVRLDKTDDAIEAYYRSLSLRKDQPQVMLALSTLYYQQEDISNADIYYKGFKKSVRSRKVGHTPQSLRLGIDIARQKQDLDEEASLKLLFKSLYPDSREYKELEEAD